MTHILVSKAGAASAALMGVTVDDQGCSLHPLSTADALAACAALQEAGFAAVTTSPPDGWAVEDWAEDVEATPEAARLILDWQMAQAHTDGHHVVCGLMAAMRALWPVPHAVLQSIVDANPLAYDFPDTFRVAPKDDPVAVAAYRLVERSGCCGSLDTTAEVDGRAFLVGCNHGH